MEPLPTLKPTQVQVVALQEQRKEISCGLMLMLMDSWIYS